MLFPLFAQWYVCSRGKNLLETFIILLSWFTTHLLQWLILEALHRFIMLYLQQEQVCVSNHTLQPIYSLSMSHLKCQQITSKEQGLQHNLHYLIMCIILPCLKHHYWTGVEKLFYKSMGQFVKIYYLSDSETSDLNHICIIIIYILSQVFNVKAAHICSTLCPPNLKLFKTVNSCVHVLNP